MPKVWSAPRRWFRRYSYQNSRRSCKWRPNSERGWSARYVRPDSERWGRRQRNQRIIVLGIKEIINTLARHDDVKSSADDARLGCGLDVILQFSGVGDSSRFKKRVPAASSLLPVTLPVPQKLVPSVEAMPVGLFCITPGGNQTSRPDQDRRWSQNRKHPPWQCRG